MVYLVDDDAGIRRSLAWAFNAHGMELKTYATADEFLAEYDRSQPGCLILDLQLEHLSGLTLLKKLREEKINIPVIIVTGTASVASAIQSMKLSVREFYEKPVDPNHLIEKVQEALADDEKRLKMDTEFGEIIRRFGTLTDRERDLVPLICFGRSNKQMAAELGLSLKTIANHRANLLAKVRAINTADFVRMAAISGQFKPACVN